MDLNKIYYKYEEDNSNEIKVQKGITYAEKPRFFGRRTKEVRIIFKEEKRKGEKHGK